MTRINASSTGGRGGSAYISNRTSGRLETTTTGGGGGGASNSRLVTLMPSNTSTTTTNTMSTAAASAATTTTTAVNVYLTNVATTGTSTTPNLDLENLQFVRYNDSDNTSSLDNYTSWYSSFDLLNATALPMDVEDDLFSGVNSSGLFSQVMNATVEAVAAFSQTSTYLNLSANETWYFVGTGNDTRLVLDGDIAGTNVGGSPVGPFDASLYPSGKSMTHIIVTAVLVTMLMIMIVVGNMLVIVAISTEKALKTIQNWFIASLAVADFLLGLVVMPFSLAQELMGYWIFGFWWCEIYLAIDVLLCTSSIMNLCLISLDRYWSITQAVDYLKKRTASRAILMLSIVWAMSFLISVPPLLGWKKFAQPKDIPFCQVSDDLGYVIYSASGSFYIPSIIMVFVYVRIYFAARSRARRVVKKHRPALDPTKDKSTTTTSFSNASPPDRNKNTPKATKDLTGSCCDHSSSKHGASKAPSPALLAPPQPTSIAVISSNTTPTLSPKVQKNEVPCSGSSNGETKKVVYDSSGDEAATEAVNNRSTACDPLLRSPETPTATNNHPDVAQLPTVIVEKPGAQQSGGNGNGGGATRSVYMFGLGSSSKANGNSRSSGRLKPVPSPSRLVSQAHALAQAQAQILLSDDMECLSELDHSSDSDQPVPDCKVTGWVRFRYLCCCCSQKKPVKEKKDEIDLTVTRVIKPRDPEREKRRIARKKERRATLILGLIMAAFILSWLPFFTLYLVRGLCQSCYIDELGFTFAFWLGYCNSALNPVIYTIFNKDFRKAFRKILFK